MFNGGAFFLRLNRCVLRRSHGEFLKAFSGSARPGATYEIISQPVSGPQIWIWILQRQVRSGPWGSLFSFACWRKRTIAGLVSESNPSLILFILALAWQVTVFKNLRGIFDLNPEPVNGYTHTYSTFRIASDRHPCDTPHLRLQICLWQYALSVNPVTLLI